MPHRGPVGVPADRRLRLPLRLRDDRPGRAERRGRVDVRAPDGLPQRLRARCSTAAPARSGSEPPRPRCRTPGATCPARWCWRRAGTSARAGSSSGTRCSSGPWRIRDPSRLARTGGRRPTTPPSTCCVRTVRCVNGEVQLLMECEPAFDFGLRHATWEHTDAGYHQAMARAEGDDGLRLTPHHRPAARLRGAAGGRPDAAEGGRRPLLRTVLGRRRAAEDVQAGVQAADLDRAPLAALAGRRPHPGPPVEGAPGPQRAHPQGPQLRAHRRDRGRGDDLAAGDARRRAQLRLPLQLDPRLDLRAVGPLHARLRLGGHRLLPLHHRHRRARRRPADRVRHRRRARPDRERADHLTGTRERGRSGSATRPTGSGRTTCGAPCSTRSTCTRSPGTGSTTGSGRCCAGRSRARWSTGGSRTAASGRCAASRSTSPRPRSCAGWRSTAAPGWPGCGRSGSWPPSGRRRRRDPRGRAGQRGGRARRAHPALRHRRARRVDAAGAAAALPAGGRPAGARDGAGHRRRADRSRGWCCATGPKETDDGFAGEEGTFTICSFWLVSALVRDRRARAGRGRCARSCSAYASPLLLYAEELDPRTGRQLATSRRRSPISR